MQNHIRNVQEIIYDNLDFKYVCVTKLFPPDMYNGNC